MTKVGSLSGSIAPPFSVEINKNGILRCEGERMRMGGRVED